VSLHNLSFDSNTSYDQSFGIRSGRPRRPRPHVRHRRDLRRSWSRSRSRSRSRSPSRERGDKDSGILTASYRGSSPHQKSDVHSVPLSSHNEPGLPNSLFLNTSMASSASDHSEFAARYFQTAAHSVEGLLGLRQGSPAYQKYIQLKERQLRLRQARSGKSPTVLDDVRSRLMTPLMSFENVTETRSMASLMSYTLGSYKPGLPYQFGSHTAFNTSRDTETDTGSQWSLVNSGEFGNFFRAEIDSHNAPAFNAPLIHPSDGQIKQPDARQPIISHQLSSPSATQQPPHQHHTMSPEPEAQNKELTKMVNTQTQPVQKSKDFYGPEFFQNEKKASIKAEIDSHNAPAFNAPLIHPSDGQIKQPDARQPIISRQLSSPSATQQPPHQHHTLSPEPEAQTKEPTKMVNTQTQPVQKSKDFYGPEFFQNEKKASVKLVLPYQTEGTKHALVSRRVVLVHLTGQKLDIMLDPSTTGRQLFDFVIPQLDLDDFYFFGFTYICEGEHIFLDADTKLHKIAPDGWKEGPKNQALPVTFTLYVRVKFYPDSLTDFRHTSSYHLLYLQLRRDVVEERFTCAADTLVRLVGLALQVEYGNYLEAEMGQGYFMLEHYFSYGAVKRFGETFLYSNAVSEHKRCSGIAESQAEIEFIKHVRHLSEYGVHFHRLFKHKSNTDTYIWVGLSQHSLILAEPETVGRSIVQEHPWSSILKISFNKRRFSIQPKTEVIKGKPPKINFYTNSYRKGRYLLQLSTDQHRFQLRMRTRPSNIETLAGDMSVELSGPQTVDAGVGDDVVQEETRSFVLPPAYVDPSLQPLPEDDWEDDNDKFCSAAVHPKHPLQYRSPPPYQPPRMAQALGGSVIFPDLPTYSLHGSLSDMSLPSFDEHQLQLLLELTSRSPDLDFAPAIEKLQTEDPAPPYPSPPNIWKKDSPVGRQIFEVTLEKERKHGIGLTIVGGETTNSLDLGIFVKSIVPGGPAARDGRIMAGDRLIAIGGTSLEGKQHHEAVEMIKTGSSTITLLVSQIRPPGTIKKRNAFEGQEIMDRSVMNQKNSNQEDIWQFDSVSHKKDSGDYVYNSDEDTMPLNSLYAEHPDGLKQHGSLNYNIKNISKNDSELKSAILWLEPLHADKDFDNFTAKQNDYNLYVKPRDEAVLKLGENDELSYKLNYDWISGEGSSHDVYSDRYASQVKKDLQLLEDIAALEASDSSSDTDFETAVKKTIEGPLKTVLLRKNSINTSSPIDIKSDALSSEYNADNSGIFSAVLDKTDGILGIICDTKPDSRQTSDGVFISKILSGSSAEKSGVLAPGDKILEVAGSNVEGLELIKVQNLLNSSPDVTVIKVLRSSHGRALNEDWISRQNNQNNLDEQFSYYSKQDSQKKHKRYFQQHQLFEPIESAPATDKVTPKVPTTTKDAKSTAAPVPPLFLGESESNTQSDVDSDVLDSSRSEFESIYKFAEHGHFLPNGITKHHRRTPDNVLDVDADDTLRCSDSEDFNAQLLALTDALDKRLAAEVSSLSSLARSSCSGDSVLISPKKALEGRRKSLLRQNKFDDLTLFDTRESSPAYEEETFNMYEGNAEDNFAPEIIEITLQKKIGVGFGFTVAGGVNTGGCYIKQLVSEPAISDGRLRPGDKILKVNGVETVSMSHVEAVTFLRNVPVEARLELLRFPSSSDILNRKKKSHELGLLDDPVDEDQTPEVKMSFQELIKSMDKPETIIKPYDYKHVKAQDKFQGSELVVDGRDSGNQINKQTQVLTIDLIKPDNSDNSLGISIFQKTYEGHMGIFVKRVRFGGPAAVDGRLQAGDQILEVNGFSFHDINQKKAVTVLREVKEKVHLTISRCECNTNELGSMSDEEIHEDGTDDDISQLADDALSLMERKKEIALAEMKNSKPPVVTVEVKEAENHVRDRYISPRKPADVYLPVLLSYEWLNDLPPLTAPPNCTKETLAELFASLSDMVESGEPAEEFKTLHQMKDFNTTDVGKLPENKSKNRYRNVLPYDISRVKLMNHANDYINASHITVEAGDKTLRYIASQGPVLDSVSDFWRLLWQEKVNIVVMLTQLTENGKVKCHCYWPQSKEEVMDVEDGALKIKQIRSYRIDGFVITQMTVEEAESNYGREVTLLQYIDWPDNGVPDSALPLMKLLQLVHLFEQGSPPVIHCSAGIGRTGTFIAMDVALATIEQGLKLDMFDIVHQLRKQRFGMIQTSYLFCYTACMEALLSLEAEINQINQETDFKKL
ncbi:hypothetical protein Btru_036087, partial [Bulinus truncatus]